MGNSQTMANNQPMEYNTMDNGPHPVENKYPTMEQMAQETAMMRQILNEIQSLLTAGHRNTPEELHLPVPQQVPQQAPRQTPQRRPQPSDIEKFDGSNASLLPTFLLDLTGKLERDGEALGGARGCLRYAFGQLSGDAYTRAAALLPSFLEMPENEGLDAFFEYLRSNYKDSSLMTSATAKISNLQIGKKGVPQHVAEYERLLVDAGAYTWPDTAKIAFLRQSLSAEIVLEMGNRSPNESYITFKDNLLQTGELISYVHTLMSNQPSFSPRTKPLNSRHPNEMDWAPTRASSLAQTKKQRALWVTKEELQKRRQDNLCIRCGTNMHKIAQFPLADIETETVIKIVITHVYAHHGTPTWIVSDRGQQWVSEMWKRLCEVLGIERKLSTAYHPQTDGGTERANQEVLFYLRTRIAMDQEDWPEWIPLAQLSLNNRPQPRRHGVSPFFLVHGYNIVPVQTEGMDKSAEGGRMAKVEEVVIKLGELNEWAQVVAAEIQQNMEVQANRHRSPAPIFKPGDETMHG
ncbi:retrovirus polyprotein [Ceratocystis lukuohia]|uniref:Retrovirus polyprotein n=1 Tax=Ceratocystis lukuohia TaxID=2019550 RepID=A0ABR4MUS5_9PEZI